MNTEFFEALTLLEKEKGIPADYLLEKIKAAIAIAVKRDYGGSENGLVEIDPEKGKFQVAIRKTVVEAVENPNTEILLNDAYKYDKKAEIGSVVDSAGDQAVRSYRGSGGQACDSPGDSGGGARPNDAGIPEQGT